MTFTEAIKSGFEHYVDFNGRASRAEYWWWVLFAVLVSVVCNILDARVLGLLASLALFLPGLSVSIRRLHDTDHSGWWVLIGLIPIVGWIVLIIFYLRPSDPGENQYGPPPVTGAPVAGTA